MSSKKGVPTLSKEPNPQKLSRGYLESKEEGEEKEKRENRPRRGRLIGLVDRLALLCFDLVDLETLDWNLWIAFDFE